MPDITLTVDGIEVTVPQGTVVVEAARQVGVDVPVFCHHPKLTPVGMCRMCLVEIGTPKMDPATKQPVLDADGKPEIMMMRGLQTACTNPVSQGMVVKTTTEAVTFARRGVLEMLLSSHPLDCPVCIKGGECPLQNLTMAHGPGKSRFDYEDKVHFQKPISRPRSVNKPEHLDVPLAWDDLRAIGTELGSGACIVLDETTCVAAAAMKIDEFYKHESCGKCAPCREGTHFLTKVWERIEHGRGRQGDIALLTDLGREIGFGPGHNCFCLLGPSSVSAVNSAIKYFSEEIQAHIDLGRCPLGYTHPMPHISNAEGGVETGTVPALVR